MIAPPNNSPNEAKCNDIAGKETFRKPCLQSKIRPDSPFALAKRTYSLSSTSINFCLVCKATLATPKILSVRPGNIKCRTRSTNETFSASTPAGDPRPIGSHPSQTEKSINNKRPTQNAGVDASVKQYPLIKRSTHVPCFIPASTPNKNPKTPDIVHATVINASDAMNRSPITLTTGLRYNNEVPKSPCTTDFPHRRNCCTFGSFSPQYAAIFSRCSRLTLVMSAPIYD